MGDHILRQCYGALMYDVVDVYEYVIRSLAAHSAVHPANAAAYNNRAVALWEIGRPDQQEYSPDSAVR